MGYVLLGILIVCAAIFAILRGVPGSLGRKGYLHQDKGEYKEAEQCFLKALSFEERVQIIPGQRIGVALQCSNLGHLYHHWHRTEDAINMFKRATDISSDLGRDDISAPVYMSLGKAYFDKGDLNLAEESLNEALVMYRLRHNSQEAIGILNRQLVAISERKEAANAPERDYVNDQFGFTIKIPEGWINQTHRDSLTASRRQIDIKLPGKANFNIMCGPPDDGTPADKHHRAKLMREFLLESFRSSEAPPTIDVSTLISGEENTVCAEIKLEDGFHGMISIIHKGIEYTMQFRSKEEVRQDIEKLILSFYLSN